MTTLFHWLKTLFAAPVSIKREAGANSVSTGADEGEYDPENPFPEPVKLEITDVFDLHAIAPRDVERVVQEYLYEARRAKFRSVRIIHGKGRGVQRRLVQRILARTPYIRDWTDAPPQSGGWGATIAHFKDETYRSDEQ